MRRVGTECNVGFKMDSFCLFCDSKIFYQCVECMKAVCSRPTCSSSVSEDTECYQEDLPKRVSKCNNCVKSKDTKVYPKKKQGNISSFFCSYHSLQLLYIGKIA